MLIKNGQVVTTKGSARRDVLLAGELIAAIEPEIQPPAGVEVIDAAGLLVLPGGVDPHTHLDYAEIGGKVGVRGGWFAGCRAAAFGGATTVVEHPGFGPEGCSLSHQLTLYRQNAMETATVDYGLHGIFQHWNQDMIPELTRLVEEGYSSFKTYTTYDGRLADEDFLAALTALKAAGGLMTLHAVNHAIITYLADALRVSAAHLAASHPKSSPDYAEALAVETGIRLAEAAGDAPLYIVHLTSAKGVAAVRAARREGRRVWAETCPHYLGLTDDCYEGDFDQALKYTMDPPLRKRADVEALWEAIFDGTISTVATDHCAFLWTEKKAQTQGNIFQGPWGIPGVETRLPFLYSEGVVKRGLSLERFVDLVSTAPARLFGLARKGRLEAGYEADVVVFDPAAEKTLTAEALHQAVDYTPFENMVLHGWPKLVFLRGRKIVDGERFLGEPGQGRFVARRPFSEMPEKR